MTHKMNVAEINTLADYELAKGARGASRDVARQQILQLLEDVYGEQLIKKHNVDVNFARIEGVDDYLFRIEITNTMNLDMEFSLQEMRSKSAQVTDAVMQQFARAFPDMQELRTFESGYNMSTHIGVFFDPLIYSAGVFQEQAQQIAKDSDHHRGTRTIQDALCQMAIIEELKEVKIPDTGK